MNQFFLNSFWKSWRSHASESRGKELSSLLSALSSKSSERVISFYDTGDLHIWKGTMHLFLILFFLMKVLAYFSKTMLNCILCLVQGHGIITEESRWWTDLPAVQTHDCGAVRIIYQTRIGQHSSPKGPATGLLSFNNRLLQPLFFFWMCCCREIQYEPMFFIK